MHIFGVAKEWQKRAKMHVPWGACDTRITKLLRMPKRLSMTGCMSKEQSPNTSKLCTETMIGQLQWLILLGQFDIFVSVMSLSCFRAAPGKGHLLRVHRIYGYLSALRHGAIQLRTGKPDLCLVLELLLEKCIF